MAAIVNITSKMRSASRRAPRPPSTRKPLTRSGAFKVLDALDQALSDLDGTFNLLEAMIFEGDKFDDDKASSVIYPLWRHFETDRAALRAAKEAAWTAILRPKGEAA